MAVEYECFCLTVILLLEGWLGGGLTVYILCIFSRDMASWKTRNMSGAAGSSRFSELVRAATVEKQQDGGEGGEGEGEEESEEEEEDEEL